jgi:hypothetical protein
MKSQLFILLIILLISCSGPGNLIGTGYLVSITENNHTDVFRFDNVSLAETMIFDSTGIQVEAEKLIGKNDPYFEIKNSEIFIYVEKKGIYEKRGVQRWKIYDSQLEQKNLKLKP